MSLHLPFPGLRLGSALVLEEQMELEGLWVPCVLLGKAVEVEAGVSR